MRVINCVLAMVTGIITSGASFIVKDGGVEMCMTGIIIFWIGYVGYEVITEICNKIDKKNNTNEFNKVK